MLKIGIVGSGFGLYGLLPAFHAVGNCTVVSMCGAQTPRLVEYCERIGLKRRYTDWKLMLKNEDLDAIALAVPPDAQYVIAKAAMKKGLHVFAEKPLAATYQQAQELFELAKKHRVTTAVDFIFPELTVWRSVKKLLDEKTYGALRHVSVDWDFLSYDIKNKLKGWKTNARAGGGALSFYGSHSLYYMEYFSGKIAKIESMLSYHDKESLNGGETGVDAVLKFKNGAHGYAHICCNARGMNRHHLMFVCERATITLEGSAGSAFDFSAKVHADGKTRAVPASKERADRKGEDPRVKIVEKMATRFVRACAAKRQMTPSFEHGVRVEKLIGEIRKQK